MVGSVGVGVGVAGVAIVVLVGGLLHRPTRRKWRAAATARDDTSPTLVIEVPYGSALPRAVHPRPPEWGDLNGHPDGHIPDADVIDAAEIPTTPPPIRWRMPGA